MWIGDLGTTVGKKIQKVYDWGRILHFISWDVCFSAVGYSAKKIKNWELGRKKVDLDYFYTLVWP